MDHHLANPLWNRLLLKNGPLKRPLKRVPAGNRPALVEGVPSALHHVLKNQTAVLVEIEGKERELGRHGAFTFFVPALKRSDKHSRVVVNQLAVLVLVGQILCIELDRDQRASDDGVLSQVGLALKSHVAQGVRQECDDGVDQLIGGQLLAPPL